MAANARVADWQPDAEAEQGVAQDERAVSHRAGALAALADDDPAVDAVVHALLAVEARIEEVSVYLSRLG
jgi:hypothetical protein